MPIITLHSWQSQILKLYNYISVSSSNFVKRYMTAVYTFEDIDASSARAF